jgi:hypothetical protein
VAAPALFADEESLSLQEILLGRREHGILTPADRRALAGQSVLVTGAGGSVGSELIRLAAECRPARLTAFEQSEYNLFRLEREVRERFPSLKFDAVLGDVTRMADVQQACRAAAPDVIYPRGRLQARHDGRAGSVVHRAHERARHENRREERRRPQVRGSCSSPRTRRRSRQA